VSSVDVGILGTLMDSVAGVYLSPNLTFSF